MDLLLEWIGTIALTIGALWMGYIIGHSQVKGRDAAAQEEQDP